MIGDFTFFALFLIGLTGSALVLSPYMAAVYQGRVGAGGFNFQVQRLI